MSSGNQILMRDFTLSEIERLAPRADEADETLLMDEETFRAFYERTARPLWVYLWRITGDRQLADDLLQETYYRFLRARVNYENDRHRRNYLYRIATNLAHDSHRRRVDHVDLRAEEDRLVLPEVADLAERHARGVDLERAMEQLNPRQRDILWLAYAEGSSHQEIAEILGLKPGSIKLLLFRAKRKLAKLLRGQKS